ncbi:MAG: TIGR03960 family B12-binding radical SAM protein [bacterium]
MRLPQEKLFEILKKVEKPARYLGGEVNAIVKDLGQVDFKAALVMPETYEIGQSNLGLKILYETLNRMPRVAAERVYSPWVDAEKVFRQHQVSPFSLENKIPLEEFDLIGISLPYELSYTNILTLFDLSGIPFRSKDRDSSFPLIIGGGNQAFNPEPIADFFDGFVVGDGENAIVEIVEKMSAFRDGSKEELLRELSKIQGFYVPSFFDVSYKEDGTLQSITPRFPDYSGVKKATVKDLDDAVFPTAPIVPSVKTVHERLSVEVQRGCVRGCRFCQAGYIYRPERQRSPEKILKIVEESLPQTGDDQISLLSLSVGDYGCLVPLVRELFDRYEKDKVSISLPATRTDTFSPEVIQEVKRVRMTGFTVAPEAGTPRMRRVINKGNSREDLYKTVDHIFKEGWSLIKFYYMCGLPFEHFEDLKGIIDEGHGALEIGRKYSRRVKIHLSVSPHVPKPHTPFQWEPQDSIEETKKKIAYMKGLLRDRSVEFKWHDPYESHLEGIFARGDRRLSRVVEKAWELGCRFDGWQEMLSHPTWMRAFQECGMNPEFYVSRERPYEEVLPWDHLFSDLKKEFLWNEKEAAYKESFIADCSVDKCTYCGVCDFHGVKNINYRVESAEGDFGKKVLKFSTRGRKLQEKDFVFVTPPASSGAEGEKKDLKKIEGKGEGRPPSLPKVYTSYRCRFTKLGEVAFLSHLELMGVLKRALSRARIPLRFSEGYHPQPRMSLGQALPVGVESLSEFLDVEVEGAPDPAELIGQVNRVLPKGLEFKTCERLKPNSPSVSAATVGTVWKVEFPRAYPGGQAALDERIRWLEEQSELMIERRKEDGVKRVDIRRFIESLKSHSDRDLTLVTRFSPEGSTRPQEVLKHLLEDPEEMLGSVRVTKLDSLLKTHAQ